MKTPHKMYRFLIAPFILLAAALLVILDKLHVNINSILSYDYKDTQGGD